VSALSIVGLITGHPHVRRRDAAYNPTKPCRHFIQSPAFTARYGRISEVAVFEAVAAIAAAKAEARSGPLS
jgi:hypothetical protein